jgi:hypothetical protein
MDHAGAYLRSDWLLADLDVCGAVQVFMTGAAAQLCAWAMKRSTWQRL